MTGEEVTLGQCRLIRGDALEVLPTLPYAGLCLADPPYGIKRDKGFDGFGGFGARIARRHYTDTWDATRPPKALFDVMLQCANQCVIFGGNFFTDLLPVNGHWIVWDKVNTMPTFGDCELAWTNIPRTSVKKVRVEYNGLLGKEGERWHPTQKPLAVMSWIVRTYTTPSMVLIDPFMGSGTTGVACINLGRSFIGIEIEQRYFDIACARIEAAYAQLALFPPTPSIPAPRQEALL